MQRSIKYKDKCWRIIKCCWEKFLTSTKESVYFKRLSKEQNMYRTMPRDNQQVISVQPWKELLWTSLLQSLCTKELPMLWSKLQTHYCYRERERESHILLSFSEKVCCTRTWVLTEDSSQEGRTIKTPSAVNNIQEYL
jgi:hypothetical protein